MKPEQIRKLREHLGMTQVEFAQRLGIVNKASVSHLESGNRKPKGPLLELLKMLWDKELGTKPQKS